MHTFKILIVSAVKICKQCLQTASVSGDFAPRPQWETSVPRPTLRAMPPKENSSRRHWSRDLHSTITFVQFVCGTNGRVHGFKMAAMPIALYLADELHWTDEAESRHRLRSGSCPRLIVPRTRLSTIGDRSFRVTVAPRAWNSLPTSITALTSLPSFKRQLKTFLFTKSFPSV